MPHHVLAAALELDGTPLFQKDVHQDMNIEPVASAHVVVCIIYYE
jgi:hypothetical protein